MAGILFLAVMLLSCPAPFSLICAVAAHEAGHILCAALLGLPKPRLCFKTAGVRLSYTGTHSPAKNLAVVLAGSFFGTLLALIPLFPRQFRLYSLGLAAMNLLPVSCLDGGGALLCTLEHFFLPDRAYRTAKTVSDITVILFCAFCIAVQLKTGANVSLMAVSVYFTVTALSGSFAV